MYRDWFYAQMLLLSVLAVVVCCSGPERKQQQVLAAGEVLAKKQCGTCHMFPEPALLDKTTWTQQVLPLMALCLGITEAPSDSTSMAGRPSLPDEAYPSQPLISRQAWEQVKSYYLTLAPDTLPVYREKPTAITTLFRFVETEKLSYAKPAVTAVKIDTTSRNIIAADKGSRQVLFFDAKGRIKQALPQKTSISYIDINKPNQLLLTHIGFSINPTASKVGYVAEVASQSFQAGMAETKTVLHSLYRPTQTIQADVNNDGRNELITCSYGHETGNVSVWATEFNGEYKQLVISERAGALQVIPTDINHDRLTDLAILFAQGDEKISCFINKGNYTFEEKEWLRFPPSYGSSSFALTDFNQDGHTDILYTCGDNADYSMILKPYHGVYLFLNKDNVTFRQTTFFPMHGAYKAVAHDFDLDGDKDIAAIAFFADYENLPEESFLYFENRQASGFKSYTLPIHHLGRWMTMDAGDIDGDGDADIVLGNYSVAPPFKTENTHWQQSSNLVYLLNTQHESTIQ